MKKYFFIILFASFLFLIGCSKDSSTPPIVVVDNVKPPYTVKYVVTFSSSAVSDTPEIIYAYEYPVGNWRIASAVGTLAYVSKSQLTNGWVKEFTVTVDKNPLRIGCSVCYEPSANASYTTKMYVNNKLVKETTWNRSPVPASSPCEYYNDSYDVY